MRAFIPLAALTALAACGAPAPRPAPEPVRRPPVVTAAPAPVPLAADWRDWPVTPGTWSYTRDDRGSLALFGTPGADALLTLRCDLPARQIFLSRAGGSPAALTIRTSSVTRALPTRPTGGTPPYVAVALAPRDPLLDAMGFSRGRFAIEQPGAPTLVVPAWAEIERVTEDCRG
ncbi:hypothetical protein [Sphingomonas sp. CROZ-RG-20F-R02-07]|uniref:hypothetical protein n=1 Tax=Sphingomonas sp. CROZ-RG-20F-R02-07 TaxID=2914832 RepID=UPI001F571FC5|nr:hypothetical protein [Sphingomonas sp. CROZ-RG-20F-R02-07]